MRFGPKPIDSLSDLRPGYRAYVLGLLSFIYVVNFVDRQVLAVLIEPIKRDLALTDTQLGLLSGLAFAIFYVTFGIPFARLADRRSRSKIIVVCMIVWSAMTAVCGAAVNLSQLVAARIGVAIGEAGCIAPAQSIIADYFRPQHRAAALSVFAAGAPLGVFLGLLLGGLLSDAYGWRITLVAIGLPGIAVALLAAVTLREPRRGMSLIDDTGSPSTAWRGPQSWRVDFACLAQRRTLVVLAFAAGMQSMVLYGMGAWLPAFYMRVHQMSAGEVGSALALINGIGAGIGTLIGGACASWLARRDRRWLAWIPAIGALAATPLYAWAVLEPSRATSVLVLAPAALLGSAYVGPTLAMVHSVSGVNLRATGLALMLFVTNLLGIGGGALLVGAISDAFAGTSPTTSLRFGLLSVLVANLFAIVGYVVAARTLRKDWQD